MLVLNPIPSLANAQPAIQPVVGAALSIGLGFLVPHGVILAGLLVIVLFVVAAYKLQGRVDEYETPFIAVEYDASDECCSFDHLGQDADGRRQVVWTVRRIRLRNLCGKRLDHVKVVLERVRPAVLPGETYHRPLDKIHDTQHEFGSTGFSLAPKDKDYVDVVIQQDPLNGGGCDFMYASAYGYSDTFPAQKAELVLVISADTVPAFERTAYIDADAHGVLTFSLGH